MNYIGTNKIVLTEASIKDAVEDAINGSRAHDSEFVRVLSISREGYGYGNFVLEITTDPEPSAEVTDLKAAA